MLEDKEYDKEVGERIKLRRKSLHLSQTELANRLGYQYRSTISKMEKGGYAFKQKTIAAVADALDTTASYLMGWTDDPFDYVKWLEETAYSIPDEFFPELDGYDRAKKYYEFREGLEQDWKDEAEGKTDYGSNVSAANKFMFSATVQIPVYGSVPAGVPIEAIQDIDGYVDIPADWADHGRFMALTVHGSSMYPKYLDGDTIVVKQQDYAATGQDAVVYVNGYDATLKTVKHEPDGSITLKPVNPEYETKTYPASTVRVLGVVKRMVRDI